MPSFFYFKKFLATNFMFPIDFYLSNLYTYTQLDQLLNSFEEDTNMKEYKLENVIFQIKDNVATIIVEKLEEYPVECTIESAREIYKALKDNKISNRTVFVRQSIINRMALEREAPKPEYKWTTVNATVEKHIAGGSTIWMASSYDDVIFERHATNNHESGFSVESAIRNLNERLAPWKIKAEIKGEVKEVFVRSVGI